MHLCESEMADGLNVLLFCDICIDMTLNLLQSLRDIYGCRAVQTNMQCEDITAAYVAIVTIIII